MLIATLISIIGRANFRKVRKRNGMPARSAMPATVRLALAPISVPLPPRQAPSDSDHQRGRIAAGPPKVGAMFLITGIIVATKGILSMIAERNAEAQRITSAVAARLPPVRPM